LNLESSSNQNKANGKFKIQDLTPKVVVVAIACLLIFFSIYFKKIAIGKISDVLTEKTGHKVILKDFDFDSIDVITFKGLSILNPEYFREGYLLKVRSISVQIKLRELLNRRLLVEKITIINPDLQILRDSKGDINVSERLRNMFKKEPSKRVRIEDLFIKNGVFKFESGNVYEIKAIDMNIYNLSLKNNDRITVDGRLSFLNGNVDLKGWLTFKEQPKKFNFSFKTDGIDYSLLKFLSGLNMHSDKDEFLIYLEVFPDKRAFLKADFISNLLRFQKSYRLEAKGMNMSLDAKLRLVDGRLLIDDGSVSVNADKFSLWKKDKSILRDVRVLCNLNSNEGKFDLKVDVINKNTLINTSGRFKIDKDKGLVAIAKIYLPYIFARELRGVLGDFSPVSLSNEELNGLVSVKAYIRYIRGYFNIDALVYLKDFEMKGEQSQYYIGPANGTIPFSYKKTEGKYMNDSVFFSLNSLLSGEVRDLQKKVYSLSVKNILYGFKILEDINILTELEKGALKIKSFDGRIFGGLLHGSGYLNISERLVYGLAFSIDGLSLTNLCNEITPIRGYISGMVKGEGMIKGEGDNIVNMIGKADFSAYKTKDECMKISKDFLYKIGATSMGIFSRDRAYDKGIMSVYFQNGFIIFRDFEISNRNIFGMKDLSIKVAPLNNRISIEHLLWSLNEAAKRAKKD